MTNLVNENRVQARGRAALTNPAVRFDRVTTEHADDGWDISEELPVLRTKTTLERPRRVISKNTSPDLSFDRSINPYRGASMGASIALPARAMCILAFRPDWISKPS
jgi:hypothetical protein